MAKEPPKKKRKAAKKTTKKKQSKNKMNQIVRVNVNSGGGSGGGGMSAAPPTMQPMFLPNHYIQPISAPIVTRMAQTLDEVVVPQRTRVARTLHEEEAGENSPLRTRIAASPSSGVSSMTTATPVKQSPSIAKARNISNEYSSGDWSATSSQTTRILPRNRKPQEVPRFSQPRSVTFG